MSSSTVITNDGAQQSERVLELFWLPGCSSCLRMKEFVEKTGLPYSAVNVMEFPERAREVQAHGINLPAARLGDRYVNGINLDQVAELIGVDYKPPVILSPGELVTKYRLITAALGRLIWQLEPQVANYKTPDRGRTVLEVGYHAASVMRIFLRDFDPDLWDAEDYIANLFAYGDDHVSDPAEAAARLEDTTSRFDDWWEAYGSTDSMDRVISIYWGHHTLLEALEREVWHTAQHTRQVAYFLAEHGIEPNGPLTQRDLEGLPLPERIHA